MATGRRKISNTLRSRELLMFKDYFAWLCSSVPLAPSVTSSSCPEEPNRPTGFWLPATKCDTRCVVARLPWAHGVGQVRHPRGGLRADRLQGHVARVHALEQADSGAEQEEFERDSKMGRSSREGSAPHSG